jgi:phosphatidylinositol alpha-1,6-mannosyltransferase
VNHLFVSQDFPPVPGGMARRYVELCRRFGDGNDVIEVSTVAAPNAARFDHGEPYRVHRQPFPFERANRFANQLRWARWLMSHASEGADVLHCGNIRPVGYAVVWTARRLKLPYVVYVNGGDLLRERQKARKGLKRAMARRILGGASGIVALSTWNAELAGEVLEEVGVRSQPPIAAIDLGTDPERFHPSRGSGKMREQWGVGDAPLLLTVARLVPHKGHDMVIRALKRLRAEFPDLEYVVVGQGHDEERLRRIAREEGVDDAVIFAGELTDDELPDAYATATLYVGLSRVDRDINAEGFGIAFVEAGASGVAVVAGNSGGVSSAVRDHETGLLVDPSDVEAATAAIASLLRDPTTRKEMGAAGRRAVETHYNWDRVARETREFTHAVTRQSAAR